MKTIEKIIQENWYTIKDLQDCVKQKICNWCWWKWHNLLKLIPNFDDTKWEKLKADMNLICNIHDKTYNKGWKLFDFLKANYILWKNMNELFYWTKFRLLIFSVFFLWTTLFGFKYYNWK